MIRGREYSSPACSEVQGFSGKGRKSSPASTAIIFYAHPPEPLAALSSTIADQSALLLIASEIIVYVKPIELTCAA